MDRKNAKWHFYVKALVISFPPVLSHTTPCFEHHHHVGATPEPQERDARLQGVSNGISYSQVDDAQAVTGDSSAEAVAIML
jgi:hypothetical protein